MGRVPLAHILSLLRLSNWDPDTYWRFRDAVPELVLSASGAARAELLRGVQRMRKHAFIVERDKDMEFEIGRVFYSVGGEKYTANVHVGPAARRSPLCVSLMWRRLRRRGSGVSCVAGGERPAPRHVPQHWIVRVCIGAPVCRL